MAFLFSIIVFLSPIPTIRNIQLDQSVGSYPILPYSSMFTNCFVWMVYGYLIHQPTVYHTNVIGMTFGLCYFYIYNKYCKNRYMIKVHLLTCSMIMGCTILFTTCLTIDMA